MDNLRILLAEDHAMVRDGLKALLNAQPGMQVVAEASDGKSAWQQAIELIPEVVVMDVSMPGMSGPTATTLIRRDCPNVRVLALTVHDDAGYLRLLLEAGASGYIVKRAAGEDLVRAIREVASGGIYLDPSLAGQVLLGFVGRSAHKMSPAQELTDREMAVVKLLARGYINREIADQMDLSIKTVEVHKGRALEKLGLRSRADLVHYAINRGWLQET
jgi:DNA-binding NarL/FixJ family response regulator